MTENEAIEANTEVQFSDARTHAEKFGEVIDIQECDSNPNWLNVLMIIDGREVVATVQYVMAQGGLALHLSY